MKVKDDEEEVLLDEKAQNRYQIGGTFHDQNKNEPNFNFDSFQFDVKFTEAEKLAATKENVFKNELLLECYGEKSQMSGPLCPGEKNRLALHESGHCYVAFLLDLM
uniref:Uncharacterized protein n=1 Tax=Meloidogyne enterolobii TaxID=390850 RepID=A0A6V7VUP1_MELEN|nr:unnamed protein product [Meloidogyne enterolobii]